MKTSTMSIEEAQRMCDEEVKAFLQDMKGKLVLSSEERIAAHAKLKTIKLDDPETQKVLSPVLEIAAQANIWETKNELKAVWIKGSVLLTCESIFKYRRVKGGVAGGVRGVLKALGWGKSQAYKAGTMVETFEDDLLSMPTGITAAKLQVLIEKGSRDEKADEIFDPAEWLEQHKSMVRDAKSAKDVADIVGLKKQKTARQPQLVEAKVEPDRDVEELAVANISAKVKRSAETGLNDVVMKSLSDTQLESWKRWLSFQDFRDEDKSESVPSPDTLGGTAEEVAQDAASKNGDTKKYPDWELVVEGVVKDSGNVDLSSIFGDTKAKIGYVVPTYEGPSLNAEPIRILTDAEIPLTSRKWQNVAEPLFAAEPDCIGLTLFDDSGKFVVESRNRSGGNLETYWIKPKYAGGAVNDHP